MLSVVFLSVAILIVWTGDLKYNNLILENILNYRQ